jgi:hypothetical protein
MMDKKYSMYYIRFRSATKGERSGVRLGMGGSREMV